MKLLDAAKTGYRTVAYMPPKRKPILSWGRYGGYLCGMLIGMSFSIVWHVICYKLRIWP